MILQYKPWRRATLPKGDCNIPRFYQILGEIFVFDLLVLIEFSQEFKTFDLLKSLI
jgi:hypothetical protein